MSITDNKINSNKYSVRWVIVDLVPLISIFVSPGIDEDDQSSEDAKSAPTEEMPPLEGDDDDASRMEEVD